MNDIEMLRPREKKEAVTVWIDKEDKELFDKLRLEYGVAIRSEVKKAMISRIHEIRDVLMNRPDPKP
jgi:hypothetical protein